MRKIAALLVLLFWSASVAAEDGYHLWLRQKPLPTQMRAPYRHLQSIALQARGPIAQAAAAELARGLTGSLNRHIVVSSVEREAGVILGTPSSSPVVRQFNLPMRQLGNEGFAIKAVSLHGRRILVIAANTPSGLLYGSFNLLRRIETGERLTGATVIEHPRYALRLLDHWDSLDGFVERGYAGRSIWRWSELPAIVDPRYTDYARANASIGINGAVLNNVNANAQILTPAYLRKVAAIAAVLRPYAMRVYLTARFSAPIEIGGLKTADPLDPQVRQWWKGKADEIYAAVPDVGGFLIKANSEGQPGPQDYRRTHADGANMLADALAPHGGVVIWRAFVYGSGGEDRTKQAFDQFHGLDGKFRPNVLLQVKNGPLDFQPREPFHPLFGQMPRTRLLMEGQITKEYLGFSTHLAFLAPLWKEVLDADTCAPRCGMTVSKTISGTAGVANIGSDRNWSGSQFDQANWYAWGRLAWDPTLGSKQVATEWARMTWSQDPKVVASIVSMMMQSREAVVNYMTPLGLAHLMGTDHHYGPAPWAHDLPRAEWNPVYYHRADAAGIGFDRTKTGTDAVDQYSPPIARMFGDLQSTPERYLLWFHHVPWDYRMRSGRTLWDELVGHYDAGLDRVSAMQRSWASLKGRIDDERFNEVRAKLAQQQQEAQWWRDACIAYFQSISRRPLPPGAAPPAHDLSYYQSLHFNNVAGTPK